MIGLIAGYLDPGSGSMILQAILGGAAGLAVGIKMFGRRLSSFVFFWRKDDPQSIEAPAEPETKA